MSSRNDLEVVVGHWMRPSVVRADAREVARVLEIPLARLLELHVAEGFRGRSASRIGDALAYPLADVRIWGVTARIVHHFLELVLDHQGVIVNDRPD